MKDAAKSTDATEPVLVPWGVLDFPGPSPMSQEVLESLGGLPEGDSLEIAWSTFDSETWPIFSDENPKGLKVVWSTTDLGSYDVV